MFLENFTCCRRVEKVPATILRYIITTRWCVIVCEDKQSITPPAEAGDFVTGMYLIIHIG